MSKILSTSYAWVEDIPYPPAMVREMVNLYGVVEFAGEKDNPIIMHWAKELGVDDVYEHDSVPWCGLCMAMIAKRAGKFIPHGFLWALNWSHFGREVKFEDAAFGDTLVFTRHGGGHVGVYIAEDDFTYHVGGGNELDAVNIVRIQKLRLYAVRRPIWKTAQPKSVKKMYVNSDGILSVDEK